MSDIRLSIIVPIYKTAAMLPRCLDSLYSLKGNDIEFILVNDGSPDQSDAICLPYLQKDTRFSYHYKTNGGLSSARNFGIKHARGQYIGFLDSDDYVEPQYWEILSEAIHLHPVEVIGFNHFYEKHGTKSMITSCFPKGVLIPKTKVLEIIKNSTRNLSLFFVWNKIYNRQWLENHQIRFDEEILLAEDKPFNALVMLDAKTQYYIDAALVNYVFYEHSLSQASFKPDLLKKYEAQFFALVKIYEKHGLLNQPGFATDIAQNYLSHAFLMQLNNLVHSKESPIKALEKMRQSPIYDFSFTHFLPPEKMSLFQKTLIFLFRIKQFRILFTLFLIIRARK